MPASPRPPRRHYWSLPAAINWRRQRPPACSNRQALGELQDLLHAGAVEVGAVVRGANPLWPDARKVAFERANLGALVTLPKNLLAEVNLDLEVDEHIDDGAPVHGAITWKRSGILAFADPRFDRDKLIRVWVALLDRRRTPPPAQIDLYRQLIATGPQTQHDEDGPWRSGKDDEEWRKNQNPPISRRTMQGWRRDFKSVRRGRHKK